jgi:hypothetical protein
LDIVQRSPYTISSRAEKLYNRREIYATSRCRNGKCIR